MPKKRRNRGNGYTELLLPADEQAALREAEALAITLGVPVAEAAQILANDREGYILPSTVATVTAAGGSAGNGKEGNLFTKSTVNAYIAAVIELWHL